ncbi:MAG: outer membrane protein OmpA-like peptidoglycan-associated protein, partial [Myxococcota bacterium]
DQLTVEVLGSIRLFDHFSVGLAIPFFAVNSGQSQGFVPINPAVSSPVMGDIRLEPKVGLLVRETGEDGFGVGIDFPVTFPTGAANSFVSDGFTVEPKLLIDLRVGPVLVALNGGARIREKEVLAFSTEVGHELVWRAGVGVDVVEDVLMVIGEVFGASANFKRDNNTFVEAVGAVRVHIGDSGLSATLGGGKAFTTGYGSTQFRVFGALAYGPSVAVDTDGDGYLDPVDKCPLKPEDFDKFQDEDGCPEFDNDNDGIPDLKDTCPMIREDFDGFEDEDGCPERDNDGDGIADETDACPNAPEDADAFEDDDGCPDPDNDQDGILDAFDGKVDASGLGSCRNEAEDRDGYQDEDGCPEMDNDGDGILDVDDDCPSDPNNQCGIVFNPCEIVITEQIFFEYDSDVIKAQSYPIIDSVSDVLRSRAWIEVLEVQGHTDSDGPDAYNLELSQRRADSVKRYIVAKGVAEGRLVGTGYGEVKPIASNKRPAGRKKNRRVQFIIVKPSQTDCALKTE